MKHFSQYIIILCGMLLTACCHDTIVTPEEPEPQPRTTARRTVIVYMAADNTPYLPVRQDTMEMAKGKDMIPEDVNFVIYLDDRNQTPAIYELSARDGMQIWKRYEEEHCSTDSLVMLNALRDIVDNFPAQHYGITFWSHATGWAPERSSARRNTFGKDQDSGTTANGKVEMEIPVMRDVLAQLPRFDYIFFDACFMQCIEVAYELRGVTDYMVGCPAEIPGPGAPYDKIMQALCESDAEGIVRGYDSGYPDGAYPGVLLSYIDCTQLDALAEATGQMLTPFFMGHTEPLFQNFQSYCDMAPGKFTYCFDMRTTMCRLLPQEDYAAWMERFDKAVPLRTLSSDGTWFALQCHTLNGKAQVRDPECYGGVSMFLPMENYNAYGWNDDFRKTSWYKAAGWQATGW